MNIELLLSPVELDQFFDQYWESQPLYIGRSNSLHFQSLLSVASVKKFLDTKTTKFPDVQLVDAKRNIPVESYTKERTVLPDRLLQHHTHGATIVVAGVHKKFTAVSELCRHVNRELRFRCQANAYLSPASNQGFHSHYDTHDVFILQISGQKTFRFYPSDIELPFTDDTYHAEHNNGGDVQEKVELFAGDTLYIPRGIVHDAVAHQDEPSLHITLGVFPFVVRDLMQELVQVAAEKDTRFRKFVDLKDASFSRDQLGDLPQVLLADDLMNEALSRLADEVAVDSTPSATQSGLVITADSIIVLNESSIHGIEKQRSILKLRVAGQVLRFYTPLADAVLVLFAKRRLRVSQLPGLEDDQRLALCQQLADVGVITMKS